jgi:hypothetical protein
MGKGEGGVERSSHCNGLAAAFVELIQYAATDTSTLLEIAHISIECLLQMTSTGLGGFVELGRFAFAVCEAGLGVAQLEIGAVVLLVTFTTRRLGDLRGDF